VHVVLIVCIVSQKTHLLYFYYSEYETLTTIITYIYCMCIFHIVTINYGPMDRTSCSGSTVDIPCGFSGGPANILFPNWRIIMRNDDGSVISDEIVNGGDIDDSIPVNGLQWIPDLNNANNSVLRVGPVNETYDQSSYQCIFAVSGGDHIISTIGTLTVTGE